MRIAVFVYIRNAKFINGYTYSTKERPFVRIAVFCVLSAFCKPGCTSYRTQAKRPLKRKSKKNNFFRKKNTQNVCQLKNNV